MAYVPCPSCRFLIGPTDTTCRWCKVDLDEVRAAKNRLKPPPVGSRPIDFVPGKRRRLGRAAKAPKAGKPPKHPKSDVDLDALSPGKGAPAAPPAPLPISKAVPMAVPVAVAAPAPIAAPAAVITAPPPPVTSAPGFARLAAPNYLVPPAPVVPPAPPVPVVVARTEPMPVAEAPAEPVAKPARVPREPRPPKANKGTWRYTTATLVTLAVIAASMATASYVVNKPPGSPATTVATTVAPTTTMVTVSSAWITYAAPDSSFTVEMPVTPAMSTAPSAGDPTITETTYDAIAGGTALKVTSYPHAIDQSQVHDLLQSFKNSALTVEGSSLVGEQETTIGGRQALGYTVAQTDTTLYFTEIFDTDRVYTLVSALGPDDSARFVASLVIAPHVPN